MTSIEAQRVVADAILFERAAAAMIRLMGAHAISGRYAEPVYPVTVRTLQRTAAELRAEAEQVTSPPPSSMSSPTSSPAPPPAPAPASQDQAEAG